MTTKQTTKPLKNFRIDQYDSAHVRKEGKTGVLTLDRENFLIFYIGEFGHVFFEDKCTTGIVGVQIDKMDEALGITRAELVEAIGGERRVHNAAWAGRVADLNDPEAFTFGPIEVADVECVVSALIKIGGEMAGKIVLSIVHSLSECPREDVNHDEPPYANADGSYHPIVRLANEEGEMGADGNRYMWGEAHNEILFAWSNGLHEHFDVEEVKVRLTDGRCSTRYKLSAKAGSEHLHEVVDGRYNYRLEGVPHAQLELILQGIGGIKRMLVSDDEHTRYVERYDAALAPSDPVAEVQSRRNRGPDDWAEWDKRWKTPATA